MVLRKCYTIAIMLCTILGFCTCCLRSTAYSWRPTSDNPKQDRCKTFYGTNWSRLVTFDAGEHTSCNRYKTILPDSMVEGFCAQGKLFNLDICDCSYARQVNSTTCRTNPAYSVDDLLAQLLARYNSSVVKVDCQPLPTENWRNVRYTSVGSQRCNSSHTIKWQLNTGGQNTYITKGYFCPANQLFNFDLCDCWQKEVTNSTTCRTKPGYDIMNLRELLTEKYNNSQQLDKTIKMFKN
ncbi:uncharacterized protein [Watersipora subatra]|uniref:uncharacterized protein isoform X2 n=1 Tax=Watersipora subatra TaxID=2589382 RepID=UPI00355C2EAF